RRLANGLRDELGLSTGDRVAILSKNAIEYQVLYFACGRAGLIAQALNWRLGTAELARILADGEPRAILVHREFAGVAEELKRLADTDHWLDVADGEASAYTDLLARSSDAEPAVADDVGGQDPFFILYSGGTTGESKGALHSHSSAYMG